MMCAKLTPMDTNAPLKTATVFPHSRLEGVTCTQQDF